MASNKDQSFYQSLLAEVADLEWQMVESQFLSEREDAEVSLSTRRDAEFWTLELDIGERELRRAVEAVGPKVSALRQYLSSTQRND